MNDMNLSDELIAAFLDGNVSEDEANRIIAEIGDDAVTAEIISLSEIIDRELDRARCQILPISALAAANPENLCSFDCETMVMRMEGLDVDNWSLIETAKANNWLREQGTPLHHVGRLLEMKGFNVERKFDADVEALREAIESGRHVIAVVDSNCLNDDFDWDSPRHHAVIVSGLAAGAVMIQDQADKGPRQVSLSKFIRAWKESGHYMVTASPEAAAYNPQPINVDDVELNDELEQLTEAIAENAHDIWARVRMDEGWTFGSERDDAAKKHPDLVPYNRLPEGEKHYDRIMAMNTLRLVRRLGFEIIPASQLNNEESDL